MPATINSASRSSIIFTGLLSDIFDRLAHSTPQRSIWNFEAKSATDVIRLHMHIPCGNLQTLCKLVADTRYRLRRRMKEHILSVCPLSDLSVRFEAAVSDNCVSVGAFDHRFRFTKSFVGIACESVGRLIDALFRDLCEISVVDQVWKAFPHDLDCTRCIFCCPLVNGRKSDDFVARPLNLSAWTLDDLDCFHTRHLLCGVDIDTDNLRVSVRRPDDLSEEHARTINVKGVLCLS